MAKIVLKDPNAPSVKRTTKPPSLKYKHYFYKMVFLNLIQTASILYLMNKEKADIFILPIIQKLHKF